MKMSVSTKSRRRAVLEHREQYGEEDVNFNELIEKTLAGELDPTISKTMGEIEFQGE